METLYKLVWIVNGTIKETIEKNKPSSVCNWKKKQLEHSTHKTGKLLVLPMKDYGK